MTNTRSAWDGVETDLPFGLAATPPVEVVEPTARVAVADDDPLALMAIEFTISQADGLTFIGAENDVDGIVQLAAREQPDAVVLDWMMPHGGGARAARLIYARCPGTCIVALTSSDSQEALLEMSRAGARRIVVKGRSGVELVDTIRDVLAASAPGARPSRRPRPPSPLHSVT